MKKQNHIFFIEVTNSIGEVPLQKGGELITMKKDRGMHGYGIRSIEKIVNKYDGIFSYQVQGDGFNVDITFFDSKNVS